MNPGTFVMGGGGAGGGKGGQKGAGSGRDQGADGASDGSGAAGGGKTASSCSGGGDGSGCPNHHGSKQSGKVAKGDPVDVVTGRVFTDPVVDFALLGPLGLRFVRRYNSTVCGRDVGLGFGWSHSFAWAVEVRRNVIALRTDTGSVITFDPFEPGGAGVGPDGWVLVRDASGFVLDDNEGSRRIFAERVGTTYRLSAVLDAYGNATKLTYDAGGLAAIEDAAGRVVRVRRHADGRIAAFEAKNSPERGRWVALHGYAYDAAGDLVSDIDAEGCATRYAYEDHRLTRRAEPEGLTFHFCYDDRGRCVETWGDHADPARLGLDEEAPPVLADGTKAKGIFHCRFEYGDDGYSEAVDSYSVHRYFGNEFGKVEKAVAGGAIYARTYDEGGNLLSFTDPLGATTTWSRDGRGRALSSTDPLGRTTVIERDPDGHVRRVVDPAGGVTEVERERGRLCWVDPIGARFEVAVDPRGLVTETVAPNGAHTRLEYDGQGNLTRRTDALGATTEWAYDHWGRCVAVRDALGNTEWYTYNQRGDRTTLRRPDGVTRYAYDGNGDIVRVEHPDGTATAFLYGGLRQLCEIRRPQGERNQLRYDREGRLTRAENARGDVHRVRYDAAGRPIYERTFFGLEKHYRYDLADRLLDERTSAGETTQFGYDAAGQVISRALPDGTTETFEYDQCGRLVASRGPAGEFAYQRNAVGWVLEERQLAGEEVVTIARTYDQMGDVVHRETSLGHRVEFERDACGRSIRVMLDGRESIGVVRDALGRETCRLLPEGGQIRVVYDALGRMTERQVTGCIPRQSARLAPLGGPFASQQAPELAGLRTPDTTLHQAFRYASTSALVADWSDADGWRHFDHDPAGQVLALRREGATGERYAYDAAGNLHEPDGDVRTYGRGNRLSQKGDTTYQWDEAGRLVAAQDGQGRRTGYEWNGLGLLAAVEMSDGRRVEFAYDSFARRVAKRAFETAENGRRRLKSTVRFVWDGGALVHELKRSARADGDPIVEERTYCFEEGRLAPWAHRELRREGARCEEGAWHHYLNDEVGTPERLVGPDGQIVGELERTTWGAGGRDGRRAPTPLRYPGQYEDEETGLVYNRYRYFDPALGRYISADPAGLKGGFNGFDYAGNAPTRFVDPDGLMPFSAVKNVAGVDPARLPKRKEQPSDHEGKSAGERTASEQAVRENPSKGYKDPAILEAVKNAQTARGQRVTGDTSCAEVDALHRMAHDIRTQGDAERKGSRRPAMTDDEVRSELQKRFRNGATIETVNEAGEVMAPCPMCAQIFRELGLHPANIGGDAKGGVIGPNDIKETKVGKMGKWDGTVVQPNESVGSRSKRSATAASSTPPFRGR